MSEIVIKIMIGAFFAPLFWWLFPSGSLGYLKGGRDDFGKWHWWWSRD